MHEFFQMGSGAGGAIAITSISIAFVIIVWLIRWRDK